MENNEQFQQHVSEALGRIEATLTSLAGNGQPGRVGRLEEDVEDLKKARWTIGGMVLGVSTGISTAIHFIFK
jgi:hypothetical protein